MAAAKSSLAGAVTSGDGAISALPTEMSTEVDALLAFQAVAVKYSGTDRLAAGS